MDQDQTLILAEANPGSLGAGGIAFAGANAARFDSAFHNEPLTEYSVGGWDRDPLNDLLEFYAPAVTVPERFHYKEANHADAFLRLEGNEDVRSMGASFGKLDTSRMDEVNDRLDEKGLTISVDKRDIEENSNAEEQATDRIRRILLRNEVRRVMALLSAAATNTNKTWGNTADPDQDVFADLLTAENATGIRPNRVGYGSVAWSLRRGAFRAQDNAGAKASAMMTTDQVAQDLLVESITLAEARYRSASNALTASVGNKVLMFWAEAGLSNEDPSNIKRFRALTDGAGIAVYRQEFPRTVEITLAHKSKSKITSTIGIRQFTVS